MEEEQRELQKQYDGTWLSEKRKQLVQAGTPKRLTLLGILLTAAGFLPYLLLGKGSVIGVNDQLDGEIFTYIFQAKYLLSGQHEIAEWMGGISKEALFPPSMLTVLLYRFLPAFTAFLVNQFLVAVTAFCGMNAFLKKLLQKNWLALFVALLFAYLPFYSVYGVTVAGIPMLVYAFWELSERKNSSRNMALVLWYAAMSSLVLLGYAVCACLVFYCAYLALVCCFAYHKLSVHSRAEALQRTYMVYVAAAVLMGIYFVCNLDLAAQVLGLGEAVVSHKSEYVLHALPFAESFWNMLKYGSGHAPSYHGWMLLPVMAVLAVCAPIRRMMTRRQKREYVWLEILFLIAMLIAGFYGLFHAPWMTSIRQSLGGFFVYFQFDRIYWFYPFLWYTMLALLLSLLGSILEKGAGLKKYVGQVFLLWVVLAASVTVLLNSDLKRNIRQLIDPQSSNAVTWEKYYGEEIFAQIREAIGREQSSYRVGSVALNPAVAAYNGFYTVDGYSNNYALADKHAFRRVIAGELAKDEALRQYFDEWGNRCYLFTAQLGQGYYYEKDAGITLSGIDWDMEALRALGCDYLFSGVEITDAQRMGMKQLGSFESKEADCRYRIWVYDCRE